MFKAILTTVAAAAIAVVWTTGDPPLQPLNEKLMNSTIGGVCYKESNIPCAAETPCEGRPMGECDDGWYKAIDEIPRVLAVPDTLGTHKDKAQGDDAWCYNKHLCVWFVTRCEKVPHAIDRSPVWEEEVVAQPPCIDDDGV